MSFRVIGDEIEYNQRTIARFVPGVLGFVKNDFQEELLLYNSEDFEDQLTKGIAETESELKADFGVERKELEDRISDLEIDNTDLKSEIETLDTENGELKAELYKLKTAAGVKERMDEMQAEIDAANAEVTRLRGELYEARKLIPKPKRVYNKRRPVLAA